MTSIELVHLSAPLSDQVLRLAVAAHLARYKGQTRSHTASDLSSFLTWCSNNGLAPLGAQRAHVELYLRWLQEVRQLRPSTVSRRLSVVACFYRTCVIDGIVEHSPAESVRRPRVPVESPTLGLSHLQFEAMLTAARESANDNDFALVATLGLLGLRTFEATGADVEAISEVHGHRVMRVHGKGDKVALVPLPPAVGRAIDRAADGRDRGPLLRSTAGTRMSRHVAPDDCRRWPAVSVGVAGVRVELDLATRRKPLTDPAGSRPPVRPSGRHRPRRTEPRPYGSRLTGPISP